MEAERRQALPLPTVGEFCERLNISSTTFEKIVKGLEEERGEPYSFERESFSLEGGGKSTHALTVVPEEVIEAFIPSAAVSSQRIAWRETMGVNEAAKRLNCSTGKVIQGLRAIEEEEGSNGNFTRLTKRKFVISEAGLDKLAEILEKGRIPDESETFLIEEKPEFYSSDPEVEALIEEAENLNVNTDLPALFTRSIPDDIVLRLFLKEACEHRVLTPKETAALAGVSQLGDEKAREAMERHNLRLVVAVAAKYWGAFDVLDSIQEGWFGLRRAVEKFDREKGSFSTYATQWIRQAISRAIKRQGNTIRVSVGLQENPKIGTPRLRRLARNAMNLVSLDEDGSFGNEDRREDDETKNEEIFVYDLGGSARPTEERAFTDILNEQIRKYLASLGENSRERQILEWYFGLNGGQRLTLEQLGKKFGNIGRERVRQLEAGALAKLREALGVEKE